MSEEKVTKEIIKYLKMNGWYIYSYDFPQSGTGTLIKPDNSINTKNRDAIIPDIIAIKNDICVFFEDKNRIELTDFEKVHGLITDNKYKMNINNLLKEYKINNYYYGIGLPESVNHDKLEIHKAKTNFIMLVDMNNNVHVFYDNYRIF